MGIVTQVETAALKKISDNRNAPFDRKMTHLYTAATYVQRCSPHAPSHLHNRYVDELDSVDDLARYTPPPFLCMIEQSKLGRGGVDVDIGLITICPSTGDVVWDHFEGTKFWHSSTDQVNDESFRRYANAHGIGSKPFLDSWLASTT